MKDNHVTTRNPDERHHSAVVGGVRVAPVNESGAAHWSLIRAEVAYMAALRIEQQALVELGKALEAASVEDKHNYAMSLFRLRANNTESLGIMEHRMGGKL